MLILLISLISSQTPSRSLWSHTDPSFCRLSLCFCHIPCDDIVVCFFCSSKWWKCYGTCRFKVVAAEEWTCAVWPVDWASCKELSFHFCCTTMVRAQFAPNKFLNWLFHDYQPRRTTHNNTLCSMRRSSVNGRFGSLFDWCTWKIPTVKSFKRGSIVNGNEKTKRTFQIENQR